ncbi:rust resistance kinase Lr10-like [Elaeis guineensis]|uniref:rust resistance kinase Lr10-like n=1 Tax=Elaeis guineensis var. tenera TaxID=51953 RepID=UPI003C6D2A4B
MSGCSCSLRPHQLRARNFSNDVSLTGADLYFSSCYMLVLASFPTISAAGKKLALHPIMGTHQVSSICSVLSFLLFFSIRLPVGLTKQKGCSSSCGLQRIRYPFRLKDDPAGCGLPSCQLSCEGNNTIWNTQSNRYYVTAISYEDHTINLVEFGLASGRCGLPSPPFSPYDDIYQAGWPRLNFYPSSNIWATFMSCTRQIKNDTYQFIPCLSHNNNTFAYVVVGEHANSLQFLEPSCRFLAAIPTAGSPEMDSTTDVFKLLQKGFVFKWFPMRTPFQQCLDELWWDFSDLEIIEGSLPSPSQIFAAYEISIFLLPCIVDRYTRSYPPRIQEALWILTLTVEHWIILAILVRLVFPPLAVYLFLAHKFWSTRASIDSVEKFLRNQQTLIPTRYSYTDIIAITSHFKEKIGQGGFGSVFKGKLLGDHLVAIKMLGNSKCDGEEFINEVSTIGRIHHVNVVQLVGFSSEGSKRALVYEYMPNGSLDKYIFSPSGTRHRPSYFTWDKLNDIALGVARGIDYLHRGCDMQILHFDIKPQNILLDKNFTPKISDFGLAKLYPKEYGLVSMSAARGTIGYIAPELISRNFGVISDKSDVYSFGMLLLEIAGGRRNVDRRVENSSQIYYPSRIYDQLAPGKELEINNSIEIGDAERKLCMVGLWCIQMKSSSRPSMSKVTEMLEGDVNSLQILPRPCFSSSQPISTRQPCMDSSLTELSIISEHDELP